MKELMIGVDIGGTTIKLGFIDLDGKIIDKWEIPTNTSSQGATIVQDLWDSIQDQLSKSNITKANIKGIGVGAPGFIDGKNGIVHEAVNIGWKDFNLASDLTALSDLPVFVENDANIAVLGENWKGAGNQAKNVIAITLGTGVGGGIIANGMILNGENGTAGEIGHITVERDGYTCNCGRKGCLETVTSATGIVRQGMKAIEKEPTSLLNKTYQEKGAITSKDIFDLANQGDQVCINIVERTTDILGFAIANMATIINPSKVLVGGGVSKAGNQLIAGINDAFVKYALPRISEACEIKIAQLGNDAGIIGAAYLVKQKLNNITF
ncbi:ROK family glucokinase [Ornithinibacillus sp. L9]|uniref:Glucokinase n=1 Tax=Ornithinibacillus caprae TaxID=2678566 RepID=A0A6N8FGE4_9BACI|nr:ROK family glucokinase [Ornithinibacillus caprae]MUK87127.1 ROK family glucokinase [Ornithinibacillus caprae]